MLDSERPGGPVAAAQKCAAHVLLSVWARGGDVRRGDLCGGSACRTGRAEGADTGPALRRQ